MNCPKCGYVSFDHLDECKNCGQDLVEHKARMGIRSFKKRTPTALPQERDDPQEASLPPHNETAIETESIETESIETESIETESIETESIETESIKTESIETETEVPEDDIFSIDDMSFEEDLGEIEGDEAAEIEIDIPGIEDEEDDERDASGSAEDPFFPDDLSVDISDDTLSANLDDIFEDREEAPAAIETADREAPADSDRQAENIPLECGLEDQKPDHHETEISNDIQEVIEEDDEPCFEEVGEAFVSQENGEESEPPFEDVAAEELEEDAAIGDSLQMPLAFTERSENPVIEETLNGEAGQEGIPPLVSKTVFLKRGLAFGVDWAILLGTLCLFLYLGLFILKSKALISTAALTMGIIATELLVPITFLALVVSAAYFTFFHGSTGQTPGKMLFDLKVVGQDDGAVGMEKAFLRWFGYIVSVLPLMGGFLMALKDKNGQALHDRIAGTYVVAIRPQAEIEEEANSLSSEEVES